MLISLKTISERRKRYRKKYDSYRFAFFMVDCRSCAYSSTNLFMAPTLKITVGCPSSTYPSFLFSQKKKLVNTSWTPWSPLQQNGELWARALVLTPEPSQANHSKNGKQSNTRFLCVAVWEPGTCGQDMGTRRSWRRFPHDEIDTALNSQVRQRTLQARGAPSETEGGMAFHQSRLWPWVAAPHSDRESHRLRWTSSATRTPTKSSANS